MAQPKEDRVRIIGEIISQAWGDEAFRQSIHDDPVTVLRQHGLEIPDGTQMRVVASRSEVEDIPGVGFLVLPPRPSEVELTDEELEHVSGGGDNYGRDDSGTGDCDPACKGY